MQPFATRIADVFIEHIGRNDQQREGRQSISRRVDWLESEVSEHRGFTSEPGYFRHSRFSRTISCLSGRLFVALVDVRADSPTFSHWQSFEFSGHDHRRLQFPAGVACGWQVLSPTSRFRLGYAEEPEGGDQRWLRWNDFLLQIPWPEIPDELAARPRPSMSLSSLHAHQLPLRQTPKPLPAIARQCKNRHRRRSIPLRSFTIAEAPTEPLSQHAVRAVCAVRNATEAEVPTSRILLLGCNGQLGYDLHMQLRPIGTVFGACREPSDCRSLPIPIKVDVTRPASLRQAMRTIKPTLVINATGVTDVMQAERSPRIAQAVNATAPQVIVDEAERLGCGIVHFCTSQVFDGSGDVPWTELSPTSPMNQVGRTKLVGTEAVLASAVPHWVLRSSWLYSARNRNFVTECVDQLGYRNQLEMAVDHWGTPTPTLWLAQLIQQLLQPRAGVHAARDRWSSDDLERLRQSSGLYHASPRGFANRIAVADQMLATCKSLGLPTVTAGIRPRRLSELHPGLPVPGNQRLASGKLAMQFGVELPRWQEMLNVELSRYLGQPDLVKIHIA